MRFVRLALVAAVVTATASPGLAAEKALDGTLVCAKCTLKKADAKACQNVLVVSDASGRKTEYYITKNDVSRKSGEACMAEIKSTVTGTISEKDGKAWLTPSKIEKHGAGGERAHGT